MTKRVKRSPWHQNSSQSYFVLIVETVRYPERATSIGNVQVTSFVKYKVRDEWEYYDKKYFFFLSVVSSLLLVYRHSTVL